jgi:hypothetical protein
LNQSPVIITVKFDSDWARRAPESVKNKGGYQLKQR